MCALGKRNNCLLWVTFLKTELPYVCSSLASWHLNSIVRVSSESFKLYTSFEDKKGE